MTERVDASCLWVVPLQSYYYYYFFIPSGVKIPRVKSKVKSKTKSWSGHSSSLEKLLWSKIESKCWIVIEMRWKRKLGSWLSPETNAILRPSSEKKAIDDSFNWPSVSAAIIIITIITKKQVARYWRRLPSWTRYRTYASSQKWYSLAERSEMQHASWFSRWLTVDECRVAASVCSKRLPWALDLQNTPVLTYSISGHPANNQIKLFNNSLYLDDTTIANTTTTTTTVTMPLLVLLKLTN